jgi:hypothetical protein
MADHESTRSIGGAPDAVERPLAPEPRGGGFLRKLGLSLTIGLVLWLAGALAVLWWEPNRLMQLAVVGLAVVVALLIPRRHVDRILAAFGVLVAIAALFYLPSYLLTTEVEFTIRNTDRDSSREIYLIHSDYGAKAESQPGESFQNVDQPLLFKVNSSDVQGQAESLKGRRVRARVFGFRIADFSKYRNVIWLEPAEAG